MADTRDLKSRAERRAGSTPALGTISKFPNSKAQIMNAHFLRCFLLFGLSTPWLATSSQEIPDTEGLHENIAIEGLSHKCHLYLPAGFDPGSAQKYPVLVLQNPSGRTRGDFPRFMPWADRESVVLVGINGPRNGMPDHDKPPIQDRTLRALTEALPLHPSLRFSTGMSGGAADGWRMVRRQPQHFAGVVMQGSSGTPGERHANLLFVIHFGAKDEWNVRGIYENVLPAMERMNIPVWVDIDVDRGHQWAPTEEQHRALTWMVNLARLTHNRLSEEERESWNLYLQDRVNQLIESEDTDTMEVFLRIAELPGRPALARRRLELIDLSEKAPKAQALKLQRVLTSDWAEQAEGELYQQLSRTFNALHAQADIARHLQRAKAFKALVEMEKRAGLHVEPLQPVKTELEAFVAEEKDAWTEPASERLKIVADLINSPRRRIGD